MERAEEGLTVGDKGRHRKAVPYGDMEVARYL